jgi:hypothetical protein
MDWSALLNKFRIVADSQLDESRRDEFLTAFEDLRAGRLGPLLTALGKPLRRASD